MAELILVVDDDNALRDILEVNLVASGYEVCTASSGAEAVKVAKRQAPALVLLDLMMPGMNGIEVCKALRADHRTCSATIIVLTASVVRGHLFAALSSGADDYVSKPFDLDEVLLRVEAGLRRAAHLRATSPLTGLPGNFEITRRIEELMADEQGFALVHADLDNFKAYNDRYGFVCGDEAITATARLLVDAVGEVEGSPTFVGHVGGDDFALLLPEGAAERVAAEIVSTFDVLAPSLHDPDDARRGVVDVVDRSGQLHHIPLLAISLGIATTAHRRFHSPSEAAAVASETKQRAKAEPGSAWWVDRRCRPGEAPAFPPDAPAPSRLLAPNEREA